MSGLIGQGYDGAANMAGKIKGVQARMKESYPSADYFHCASHRVNLAATDAAATIFVGHLLSRVQGVIVYFAARP